jgi:transposase
MEDGAAAHSSRYAF